MSAQSNNINDASHEARMAADGGSSIRPCSGVAGGGESIMITQASSTITAKVNIIVQVSKIVDNERRDEIASRRE
jgi:hypothetical protein